MNQQRLMQVLLAPQISEKATYAADKNEQVVFRVASDATKPEVKAAVEMLFKVSVESVQIANVNGKSAAVVCSTGHASAIVPVNRPLLSNNGVAQKAQFQSACLKC